MNTAETTLENIETIVHVEDFRMFNLKNWHFPTWKKIKDQYGERLSSCFDTYAEFISTCVMIHVENQSKGAYSYNTMLHEVAIKLIVNKQAENNQTPGSIGSQYIHLYVPSKNRQYSLQYPTGLEANPQEAAAKIYRRFHPEVIPPVPKQEEEEEDKDKDKEKDVDDQSDKLSAASSRNSFSKAKKDVDFVFFHQTEEDAAVCGKQRDSDRTAGGRINFKSNRNPNIRKITSEAFNGFLPCVLDDDWIDRIGKCKQEIDMIIYKSCNQIRAHPYFFMKSNEKADHDKETKFVYRQMPATDKNIGDMLSNTYGSNNANSLHTQFAVFGNSYEVTKRFDKFMKRYDQ